MTKSATSDYLWQTCFETLKFPPTVVSNERAKQGSPIRKCQSIVKAYGHLCCHNTVVSMYFQLKCITDVDVFFILFIKLHLHYITNCSIFKCAYSHRWCEVQYVLRVDDGVIKHLFVVLYSMHHSSGHRSRVMSVGEVTTIIIMVINTFCWFTITQCTC